MVTKKEVKEHEKWVRQIAREEALKCIREELSEIPAWDDKKNKKK